MSFCKIVTILTRKSVNKVKKKKKKLNISLVLLRDPNPF